MRIFLNTSTDELSPLDAKLQAFYHYIQEGAVESELSQTICDKITTLKNDSITRRYYMMTALKIADLQRDAYEEGISLGMVRGREEGISLGREEGISLGREEGISLGREEGISLGREEGISLGREEGISLGREEGAYQRALETAKAMISIGLPEEQIQLCTGLPLETIRELI